MFELLQKTLFKKSFYFFRRKIIQKAVFYTTPKKAILKNRVFGPQKYE